jgi:signal transduction histidine kinase/CheY-like chemotaxis protein
MPHGQCYFWQNDLIALHAIADGLIALAYFSIPLIIFSFVRKRRDLPFQMVFLMFGAFIVACGTTHILEVSSIWIPHYWLSGWVKAATALISLVTAVAMVRIAPRALDLPSPAELKKLNESLEERVQARTVDLAAANDLLSKVITQREQAEAEVRRLNQSLENRVNELQTVFDLVPVAIGLAQDPECRDIRINEAFARILGLPKNANGSLTAPQENRSATFKVFHDGRELLPHELPMQRAARENTAIQDFHEVLIRADGQQLELISTTVPLRDAEGKSRGCVAAFLDVTAQRSSERDRLEFERRLQETRKFESLGVLAGGIAHDFNNLLTGILGNASLARLEVPPEQVNVHELLNRQEQAAMRAADLCRQMLAFAGKGRFVMRTVDLSRLIEDSRPLLSVSAGKENELEYSLSAKLPAIQADAAQMRQILVNLVSNSAEAIGSKGGRITISTTVRHIDADWLAATVYRGQLSPGEHVCLEVTDNGSGMDEATLAKIFDPFFTTKFTGRGLGLAAVLGIARGHKGGIAVRSTPGQGTVFSIIFPAHVSHGSSDTRPHSRSPIPVEAGAILIVDDEETVRMVAARALRVSGKKVVEASDGHEALALARTPGRKFALVLLDLTMPRLDGEATYRALREIDPGVCVVLMSGYSEQETLSRFSGQEIAGFLAKPFTAAQVLEKVREALES